MMSVAQTAAELPFNVFLSYGFPSFNVQFQQSQIHKVLKFLQTRFYSVQWLNPPVPKDTLNGVSHCV
jgi:hypothetical protein